MVKVESSPCIVRLWECDGAGVLPYRATKKYFYALVNRNIELGAVFTVECAKVRASVLAGHLGAL